MNCITICQRRFDSMEAPDYYDETPEAPDALELFLDGFAEASGFPRSRAYDVWLAWVGGEKDQSWVTAQEEAGYERGLEHGRHLAEERRVA